MGNSKNRVINIVNQNQKELQIKRNCQQIASGILVRLNINPQTNELTTLFENCNESNNLFAVREWIYALSPGQDSVSLIDIDEFKSELVNHLDNFIEF